MADELIDICDEENNLLNVLKLKSEAHKEGLWHRTAHVWVYNPKGEVLFQLRAKDKDTQPNVWDVSAAGHMGATEDPFTAAMRETKEELGLTINPEKLVFLKICKRKVEEGPIKDYEFNYVYTYCYDGELSALKVQEEEIQEIRFVAIDKAQEEIKTFPERFSPRGPYWDDIFESIRLELS